MKNIYVGNLSPEVTQDDLVKAFEAFGRVGSGRVIYEKYTRASKGFGFVEMNDDAEALAAIQALNGSELMGRNLVVNEARPRRGDR